MDSNVVSFGSVIFIVLSAAGYAVLAILIALLSYFALRRVLKRHISEDTQQISNSVIVRLGALHALILALVFAQEQINYTEVRHTLTEEVAATADVYYSLKRFEAEDTLEIQRHVAQYVWTVVVEEWPLLREGNLSPAAWEHYTKVELGMLRLDSTNPVDIALRAESLADWDEVSEFRRARELAANHHVPASFWVVAILGYVLVSMSYFVFEPNVSNLSVLSIFGAYHGIVLYFIVSFSNPFVGAANLSPIAFEHLFLEDMAALLGHGLAL